MSQQQAITFIQKVSESNRLKKKIQNAGCWIDMNKIVEIARKEGFNFTSDQLRVAFEKDWGLRLSFYSNRSD